MFYMVFFLLICSALVLVTIAGRDFYPFSNYPMFSAKHQVSNIKVFRVALETQEGKLEWWQHEAFRYPEFVGKKLKQIYDTLPGNDGKASVLANLQKYKLLAEVLRLIRLDGYAIDHYRAFHLIERTISNNLEIKDKTVEIVLFSNIKNGMVL
jgi:hypothetical protein